VELARLFEDAGVAALIVTDIARDGTLSGVGLETTGAVADAVDLPVIASGGVAGVADLHALKAGRAAHRRGGAGPGAVRGPPLRRRRPGGGGLMLGVRVIPAST
jgi:tRNA-dihydrouridine synthase